MYINKEILFKIKKPPSQSDNQSSEINTNEIYKSISNGCVDNYANELLNLINRNANATNKNDIYTILTNSLANAIK